MTDTGPAARPGLRARRTPASRVRATATAVACVLVLSTTAGCTSAVAGTPTSASTLVSPARLCPGTDPVRDEAAALVACISTNVSRYWTTVLGQPVQAPFSVDPAPVTVPAECRDVLDLGTAFYCPTDATIYVTAALLDDYAATFGDELSYALALLVAHEFGHVVQFLVGQPELDAPEYTDEISRTVEQQADCLAGMWARQAARAGQLNPASLRAVAEEEFTILSQLWPPPGAGPDAYDEDATHGTVEQRLAAFDRGLTSRTATACNLVGLA